MTDISRRDAIRAAGTALAAAGGAGLPLYTTAAEGAAEPLLPLFEEWKSVSAEVDAAAAKSNAIYKSFPDWYKSAPYSLEEATTPLLGMTGIGLSFKLLCQESQGDIPEGSARTEMMQRLDAWKAEAKQKFEDLEARRDALDESSGYNAADKLYNELEDRMFDLERQIIEMPASTLAGIAVKLRFIIHHHDEDLLNREPVYTLDKFIIAAHNDATRLAGAS